MQLVVSWVGYPPYERKKKVKQLPTVSFLSLTRTEIIQHIQTDTIVSSLPKRTFTVLPGRWLETHLPV